MRLSIASSALAAAFVLTPVAAGYAPALCQDFSITNQVQSANPWRRDLMRQLQAWWSEHAYYPKHASNNDEEGIVKLNLVILPDGRIWTIALVTSSGSPSLDTAADAVFRGAFVRPSPVAGEPQADMNVSLHYVLTYRHDQPAPAGYTPPAIRRPFTVTNDPVKSPILETMLQRTCTGTIALGGIPNHPWYGTRFWAQAVFFRKPDGTPWVKLYERGYPSLSPVTQVGKMLTWTGREERIGIGPNSSDIWRQYTVWPAGDNHLRGTMGQRGSKFGVAYNYNEPGDTVDLTCATETLPTVTWNDWLAEKSATSPGDLASVDPP